MPTPTGNTKVALVRLSLAITFAIKGLLNLVASPYVIADFERFRYPGWFRFVVGGAEIIGAILILRPQNTDLAVTLLASIMVGAAFTLVNVGDFRQALVPVVILTLVAYVGWYRPKA